MGLPAERAHVSGRGCEDRWFRIRPALGLVGFPQILDVVAGQCGLGLCEARPCRWWVVVRGSIWEEAGTV